MTTPHPLNQALQALLAETFRGADDGSSWFLDDDGLLATARGLSAEQASRSLVEGGSTVAGHLEHVRWFVALLNAFARGERPEIRWSESWSVRTVDDAGWRSLLAALEASFEELHGHFGHTLEADDPQRLMPALATVVHAAYHVGAVRQMVLLLD